MKTPNIKILIILYISICTSIYAQESDLKQLAIDEFKKANYQKAVELLKQTMIEGTTDAEVYYYLGYFTHYLCYDSKPLPGYDMKNSDQILKYLDKAIELNPKYGDAYYFKGAEYGARAHRKMQIGDIDGAINQLVLGKKNGGYPDWLIEYGKNILKTCEKDAILFVGGDAEANPVQYLQLVENYRNDVTVIPVCLLDRPWYVRMIKNGILNLQAAAPISWSDEQIFNMHPYKWKANTIEVKIPKDIQVKYDIEENVFEWNLKPDLKRESKEFLSPIGAVLTDILETNQWERPVYFSIACHPWMYYGLNNYFQLCGTTWKLLPVKTTDNEYKINSGVIEKVFMDESNYKCLTTIVDTNMPRASGILNNYRVVLFRLCENYFEKGNKIKARAVLNAMENNISDKYVPLGFFEEQIASMKIQLEK
jgi:tetratricopeptide (TPR) repeat protein